MDRSYALALSRREAARLAGQSVSEVTPSRRDFAMYAATQKDVLAVIARLSTGDKPTLDALVERARACDDADVAALAVATGVGGLSVADMAAVAEATSAPILRDDFIVDASQLYHSRLHGADAAVLPATELDTAALEELAAVASSLHMAAVIEVVAAGDLAAALRCPRALIGLRCTRDDGTLDVAATRTLAHQVPRQRTTIVLAEPRSLSDCAALRGACDAVVAGAALLGTADIRGLIRQVTGE